MRLGSYIEDVEITAPHADVEIGGAREAVLVSPVMIHAGRLSIRAERLIVEAQPEQPTGAISLEAAIADTTDVISTPLSNGDVTFTVSWQDDAACPWTNFRSSPTDIDRASTLS